MRASAGAHQHPVWRYAAGRSDGSAAACGDAGWRAAKTTCPFAAGSRARWRKPAPARSSSRSSPAGARPRPWPAAPPARRSTNRRAAARRTPRIPAWGDPRCREPGLAIPDQQLRKRAQRREDQRASTGARVVPTPDCGLCSGGEGFEPSWTARSARCARSTLSGGVPAELIGREEERASIGGFLERSEHAPTALGLSGELRRRSSTSPRAPASSPRGGACSGGVGSLIGWPPNRPRGQQGAGGCHVARDTSRPTDSHASSWLCSHSSAWSLSRCLSWGS
jgi:hypothetical protein